MVNYIYDQDANIIQWGKDSLFNPGCWQGRLIFNLATKMLKYFHACSRADIVPNLTFPGLPHCITQCPSRLTLYLTTEGFTGQHSRGSPGLCSSATCLVSAALVPYMLSQCSTGSRIFWKPPPNTGIFVPGTQTTREESKPKP